MNENLKITIAVSGAFIFCLTVLSSYLGMYESGILYDTNWDENFSLYDIFETEGDILNPKHVTIEFLKRIFGE
tara:strand:+ start:326 stop:544 length:219 start_codon:yes stop_codon:yes gene_type:complete